MATSSSGRGKGTCPKCHKLYVNRYKPKTCPRCNFDIGGSYVLKVKTAAKAEVPASTIIFSGEDTQIFSVMTTTRNDRCFVTVENGLTMCQNAACKQARSVFVNSGDVEAFTCKHSEKVRVSSEPALKSYCTPSKTEEYTADNNIKAILMDATNENTDLPQVVQVSEYVFAVFGQPSASNPIG